MVVGLSKMNRVASVKALDSAAIVIGAGAVIVGDDCGAKIAVPGVPSPCKMTNLVAAARVLSLCIEPLRKCSHISALAVSLSEFTNYQRDLLRYWEKLLLPTTGIIALTKIVEVSCRCQLVKWIYGPKR